MQHNLDYITDAIGKVAQDAQLFQLRGNVLKVTGTLIRASVPNAKIGELLSKRRGIDLLIKVGNTNPAPISSPMKLSPSMINSMSSCANATVKRIPWKTCWSGCAQLSTPEDQPEESTGMLEQIFDIKKCREEEAVKGEQHEARRQQELTEDRELEDFRSPETSF